MGCCGAKELEFDDRLLLETELRHSKDNSTAYVPPPMILDQEEREEPIRTPKYPCVKCGHCNTGSQEIAACGMCGTPRDSAPSSAGSSQKDFLLVDTGETKTNSIQVEERPRQSTNSNSNTLAGRTPPLSHQPTSERGSLDRPRQSTSTGIVCSHNAHPRQSTSLSGDPHVGSRKSSALPDPADFTQEEDEDKDYADSLQERAEEARALYNK